MKVCPECKIQFPKDSKVEYCICGHKFKKNIAVEDIMSDFFGGFNEGKKSE